jgi:hypothetical protein
METYAIHDADWKDTMKDEGLLVQLGRELVHELEESYSSSELDYS